jgi:hypothetical protein
MPGTHDLSLVITAHRGGQMLDACLDSAAALEPAPWEVIVPSTVTMNWSSKKPRL